MTPTLYQPYIAPLLPDPYFKDGHITVGQSATIQEGAKTSKPQGQTNNARRETLAIRKTYSGPRLRGQRWLIPAMNFTKPYCQP